MTAGLTSNAAQLRSAVVQAARGVGPVSHVARVGPLDVGVFRAFAKGGVPFVIAGLVPHWPISSLSRDELLGRFGTQTVSVRHGDYVRAGFSPERQFRTLSMAEFLQEPQGAGDGGPPPYAGNQQMPELTSLCRWPPYFDRYDTPRVWLGPRGTVTPMHCDYTENLFAQIWGRKLFSLCPPHAAQHLNVYEANPMLHGTRFDPDAPDYETYPGMREVKVLQCIVEPGELLYLPAGWFHQVRALDTSLSCNRWSRDRPLVLKT